MNTYKRDEKISNDTIFTQKNQLFYYVHIYTKSGGFIRRISTKERISATKCIYKITTFLHLSFIILYKLSYYNLKVNLVFTCTKVPYIVSNICPLNMLSILN